eukprot:Phypoly_transcript_19579.p1 GENE.Phypoly_transcript_19579~~Phypoly_transcript_19579.p1  ORF type:complete len:222 (+),score=51.80 Phypoly_transcript_19579:52-666(+)
MKMHIRITITHEKLNLVTSGTRLKKNIALNIRLEAKKERERLNVYRQNLKIGEIPKSHSIFLIPLVKAGLLKIDKAITLRQETMEYGIYFPVSIEIYITEMQPDASPTLLKDPQTNCIRLFVSAMENTDFDEHVLQPARMEDQEEEEEEEEDDDDEEDEDEDGPESFYYDDEGKIKFGRKDRKAEREAERKRKREEEKEREESL